MTEINRDIPDLPLDLQRALDALLHGSAGMVHEALAAMPQAEAARLTEALESERTEVAVTFLYPSGSVRVRIVGDWNGEKVLWSMTPNHRVIGPAVQ